MINTKGVFIPNMKLPASCGRCPYACGLIMKNEDPGFTRHKNCPMVSVTSILNIDGDELLTLRIGNTERVAYFSILPVDVPIDK